MSEHGVPIDPDPCRASALDLVLHRGAFLKDRADALGDQLLVCGVGCVDLEIGAIVEIRNDRELEVPRGDRRIVAEPVAADLRNRSGQRGEAVAHGLLLGR